jgi:GNAT superfamily N-acetyltransferase
MYSLKLATHEDIPKLLEAAEKAFSESPYKDKLTYSSQRSENMIRMLLDAGTQHAMILMAVEDDGVKGVIAGMVTFTVAGLEEIVTEFLWWVDKEYRGTKLSITLINGLEFWAKRLGVNHVVLGSMENEHSGTVDKYYKRKGYKKAETTYIKELK